MDTRMHATELLVRDYECDAQGIVNNACYLHYLEHARHLMLQDCGVTFSELAQQNLYPIVTRIDISYRASLTGGETIHVLSRVQKKDRFRVNFYQTITRNNELTTEAVVTVAVISIDNNKKPVPQIIENTVLALILEQAKDNL